MSTNPRRTPTRSSPSATSARWANGDCHAERQVVASAGLEVLDMERVGKVVDERMIEAGHGADLAEHPVRAEFERRVEALAERVDRVGQAEVEQLLELRSVPGRVEIAGDDRGPGQCRHEGLQFVDLFLPRL